MKKNALNYEATQLRKARQFRREMTASEHVLWERIRKEGLGFAFKRQVPVGPYVLDFYCPEASLCVEVDGEQHAERQPADQRRDRYLADKRIQTLRIPSLDLFVLDTPIFARRLDQIQKLCEERTGRGAWDRKRDSD